MPFAGLAWLVLLATGAASEATAPPAPSCQAAEYRGLDFWIGRWRVETPNSSFAGESHVESALSGCVLLEHWKGIFLTTGKVQEGLGVHRYDAATGQWRQAWTDDTGGTQDSAGRADGPRIVYGEANAADGTRSRMTLAPLPEGRVEQKGERWDEATQAWVTTFHLIYIPEK